MKAVWHPSLAVGGGYQVHLTGQSGKEVSSIKTEIVRQSSSAGYSIQDRPISTRKVGSIARARTSLQSKQFFGRCVDLSATKNRLGQSVSKEGRLEVLNECKTEQGACGAYLEDVPHLVDWLGEDLPTYPNPLKHNPAYAAVKQYFVEDDDVVAKDIVVKLKTPWDGLHFRRAGPRAKIYFKGDDVRACIVTCGGLCPGGYSGFYSRNTKALNPKLVNDIHKRGGTMLGTSRGGHDLSKIVDSIQDRGINQVYIIGGDGTQRGAEAIHEEVQRRGLKTVVAGIPKTIDNDIAVIDKSFGFDTAVEEAQRAINAAHVESESTHNSIGLVKLMGRYSGYIAMHATLASRDVDCCLIPEVPFYLEGPGGLFEFVEKRLHENGHMVIVTAEGAGQELLHLEGMESGTDRDASGNRSLLDIGLWLSQKLKEHFKVTHNKNLNLKYIDPTYMIRAIPSNASDNVYCTLLAHSAIHGAMAGYSGFTVGPVNGRHTYIPINRVTATQNRVNVSDRMWARLLSSTNQPDFLNYESVMRQRQKLQEEVKQGLLEPVSSFVKPGTGNGIALQSIVETEASGDTSNVVEKV